MKLGKDSFINKFSNVYSEKSCNNIIEWFEQHRYLAKAGNAGLNRKINNSEIAIEATPQNNFWDLDKTLNECTNRFKKIYPEIDKNIERWNIDPSMQLTYYEPNQFYNILHCENDGHPRHLNRVFAWMIFLNTIKKGGGTYFKYQDITAEPVAGDFYIWPTSWTHFHQGVKAPEEKKYILTGWYNYV